MSSAPIYPPVPSADDLNAKLAAGGFVQVTTYGKSWLYEKRHAGFFTQDADGSLYVRRGKSRDCLAHPGRLLVAIRTGRFA